MNRLKFIFISILCITINVVVAQQYASFQKELDGGYYKLATGNIIYFKIYDEYNGDTLTFNVYNDSHSIIASNTINSSVINTTSLKSGYNEYSINCNSSTTFPSGYYILEIINQKKEKFYLRFKK